MNFLGTDPSYEVPRIEDYKKILSEFRASMIIVRYGRGTISKQTICYSPDSDTYEFVERDVDTGYENTPDEEKRGFGDRLTAKLTEKLVRDGRL
jgi:hypothetical protein